MESQGTTPVDVEAFEDILCSIRDSLQHEDKESLTKHLVELESLAPPQSTMDLVAPQLFREPDGASKISPSEVLTIVGYLVMAKATLYLRPVSRAVKREAHLLSLSENAMFVSSELQAVIVQQLSNDDVEVSSNSTETVISCSRKLGLSFAEPAMKDILDAWRLLLDQSSGPNRKATGTVCVRFASTIFNLLVLDEAFSRTALQLGLGDVVVRMLRDDSDPLVQLSVLDLLETLGSSRPIHSSVAEWIFSKAISLPILGLAGGHEDEDPDPILGGPALRVVASLCKMAQSQMELDNIDDFLLKGFHRALHNFETTGELDRLAMVDALSSFASASPDALQLVLDDPVTRNAWLSLSVAQPKLKAAILISVAMVMHPQPLVNSSGDTEHPHSPPTSDVMKLYSMVGQSNGTQTTELLVSLAKSPLPEIRIASYTLLNALAYQEMGAQLMLSEIGFFEFLLDRESESTKEGREMKHQLVDSISSSSIRSLLANEVVRKLDDFVKEGPHYRKAVPYEIATAE